MRFIILSHDRAVTLTKNIFRKNLTSRAKKKKKNSGMIKYLLLSYAAGKDGKIIIALA